MSENLSSLSYKFILAKCKNAKRVLSCHAIINACSYRAKAYLHSCHVMPLEPWRKLSKSTVQLSQQSPCPLKSLIPNGAFIEKARVPDSVILYLVMMCDNQEVSRRPTSDCITMLSLAPSRTTSEGIRDSDVHWVLRVNDFWTRQFPSTSSRLPYTESRATDGESDDDAHLI